MIPTDLLIALGSLALLPLLGSGSRRAVGWAIVGALFIILGAASAAPDWAVLGGLPLSFVMVSAGFVWLGLGCIGFAAWAASREVASLTLHRSGPAGANAGITAAALIIAFVFYQCWPLLEVGTWRGIVAALGLGGAGVVVSVLLSLVRVGQGIRWLDERWLARKHSSGPRLAGGQRTIALGSLLIALAVTLGSGHLLFAVGGALLTVVVAHRFAREMGAAPSLPIQPILAAASLLTFAWLVVTIAGPDIPLRFPGILDAPLSETAEALLALILGLGAWVLLGLWPFHSAGPGSALALVGGGLLLRWGMGLTPLGMMHAAPLLALVAAVAALHAAATGRAGEYVAALGGLAVTTGHPAVWGIFALASLLAVLRLSSIRPPIPGLERRELGGIVLIPLLGAVLPAALRGETVLTVVAVLAGVALFRPTEERR